MNGNNTSLVPLNPTLPAVVSRQNSAGKILGTTQHFSQSLTAREVKDQLRRAGKTGKELTKAVNETLMGEKDMRQQLGTAYMQALFQDGFVPDFANVNKNATKATVVLVKPVEKLRITEEHVKAMSDEERKELLALLGVK
jgi:hypothetical protein